MLQKKAPLMFGGVDLNMWRMVCKRLIIRRMVL
jgi:hypothetical protein